MVNLASISLDMYETSVLEKGLKFISTPQQASKEVLIHGGKKFARNIKVAYSSHDKTDHNNYSPKLFVAKSSWEPPDNYSPQDIKSSELINWMCYWTRSI